MATRVLVKTMAFFNRSVLAMALLTMSLSAQAAGDLDPADSTNADVAVGTVGLVLGKAYLLAPDQKRRTIKVGTEIFVNDQVYTEGNGHVHIHFIDDALVSVRPDSLLEVIRYDYDKAQPANSTIKFSLVEGVTRAISGDGAKSARTRFRLNTPIAAIGVRGTDFVVSATEETTRALVYEGAIVLAPFSSECTMATYGPCGSNAVELTDNSLHMIELNNSTLSPQLIPAPHEREPGIMRDDVQLALNDAEEDSEDQTVGTDVYLENVTSRKVAAQAATVTATPMKNFVPATAVASNELMSRQLVWGRWADGVGDGERITLSFAEANPGRSVTVADSGYSLYLWDDPAAQVNEQVGPVSFSLNTAQAFYNSKTGIVAMEVNSGKFDVDFSKSLFSTQLNLNNSATGAVDFRANGSISTDGYFNSRSNTQGLTGALSKDGKEAGYFFEKQLLNGNIQGLTLWDNQ